MRHKNPRKPRPLRVPLDRRGRFQWSEALPAQLLAAQLADAAPRINITAVARALERRFCSVWNYCRGKQRWPADDWLKAMIMAGAVSEGTDCFSIRLAKTREMARAFDRLIGLPCIHPEKRTALVETLETPKAAPPISNDWKDFIDGSEREG